MKLLLSATGARFHWVLLGSVWNDSSMSAWRMGTEAFIPWVSCHWLSVALGAANFPALPSCAAARDDQALQGFCRVGVTQKTKLCVPQVGSNLPGTVHPALAEIRRKAKQVCPQMCLPLHPPLCFAFHFSSRA